MLERIRNALQPFGSVSSREHGDVVSLELEENGQTVFSFQMARRSAQIGVGQPSPWPPVALDSLEDLIAAKMAALVARGAPRDFLDIRELCRVGLASVDECWRLWRLREEKRGVSAPDGVTAREAVLLRLSRIAQTRPLSALRTGSIAIGPRPPGFGTNMNSPAPDANWLDSSLYPDVPAPRGLTTLAERVDFVVRVCGAWDFGLMPRPATLRELRAASWRPAVEEANLLTSCAWHLLCEWHGLPPARYLGPSFPEIERDPCLAWM